VHFSALVPHRFLSCRPFHTFHLFHLGRSPITTRQLWRIFAFFTVLRNLRISHHFEKSLYFSPLRKIFIFFTTLINLCIFHLGRSPITTRPLLKNICIFRHFKIFVFSTWAGRPLQQDHFEESLHFSPFWEIFAFLTTLKNLCIFHHLEKSSYFSPL